MTESRTSPPERPAGSEDRRHGGEALMRVGMALAAVGALATLVALLPLVAPAVPSASWLWFVAVGGIGVGVAMALWGVLRAARVRSRYLAGTPDGGSSKLPRS